MTAADTTLTRPLLGNVQALRAIAALLVVLNHAALPDVGVESLLSRSDRPWLGTFHYIGLFGVDLFFVISGFIMLVTNWNAFGNRFAGVHFLARRIVRIYPPYWLAMLPILPVLLFFKNRLMVSHAGARTGIVESIFLLPNQNKFVLTVGWTLVWEMIFYIVFSQLLRLDRKYIMPALAIWFFVQIGLFAVCSGSPNFYLNFISTPLPMEFIFGTAVGLLYVHRVFPAPRLAATVALALAAVLWFTVDHAKILLENPDSFERIALFGLPALLLVYGAVALEVRAVFVAPRFMQAIGDGSYAIYLWHLSILVILRQLLIRLHPAGEIAHAAILLITICAIVAFSLAVYRYFERPVTARLNRLLAVRLPIALPKVPVVVRNVAGTAIER